MCSVTREDYTASKFGAILRSVQKFHPTGTAAHSHLLCPLTSPLRSSEEPPNTLLPFPLAAA